MNIVDIEINKLFISSTNVRKMLNGVKDETNISDLAKDINTNGLINPITVLFNKNSNTYEIIAGQRRFLAMKKLNKEKITCNILEVDTSKAHQISLVENMQRNPMTSCDKVKAFAKLYEASDKNMENLSSKVNISNVTIQKYLKLRDLPEEVLHLLDMKSEISDKISIDIALELVKSQNTNSSNVLELLAKLNDLTSGQKLEVLKLINNGEDGEDGEDIDIIKNNVKKRDNNKRTFKDLPYVIDNSTLEKIIIPNDMYDEIVGLIMHKTNGNLIRY